MKTLNPSRTASCGGAIVSPPPPPKRPLRHPLRLTDSHHIALHYCRVNLRRPWSLDASPKLRDGLILARIRLAIEAQTAEWAVTRRLGRMSSRLRARAANETKCRRDAAWRNTSRAILVNKEEIMGAEAINLARPLPPNAMPPSPTSLAERRRDRAEVIQ